MQKIKISVLRPRSVHIRALGEMHRTIFGRFSDKNSLKPTTASLKRLVLYGKVLGQENRQSLKERDPTVKLENNYSPIVSLKGCLCKLAAVVLRLCFDLLL